METFTDGRDKRHKIALKRLESDFPLFLQTLMIGCGFQEEERAFGHKFFLNCMLLSLRQIVHELRSLRSREAKELNEREILFEDRLQQEQLLISEERKVSLLLQLLSLNYSKSLKALMLHANFDHCECEESHYLYISFFSMAFLSLSDLYFSYIRTLDNEKVTTAFLPFSHSDDEELQHILNSSNSVVLAFETRKSLIYSITHEERRFALKVFQSLQKSSKHISTSLDRELETGKFLQHPAFRKPIKKTTFRGRQALVLEWVNGKTLTEVIKEEKLSLKEKLEICREITSALSKIHHEGFMHLNLCCDHIIYDKDLKSIKVIGNSSCRRMINCSCIFDQEKDDIDFRYLPPERSGRVNRDVDFRSDFYSLGVIFYKLLSGRYPFQADNAHDMIKMHILKEAPSVTSTTGDIPIPISSMISKLMKKDATERYQSSRGILFDLELMVSEIDSKVLNSISLGEHDWQENFMLPQRLVNRSSEYETLCEVLNKTTFNSFEMIFISGESGVGKSALAFELYKPVAEMNGIFIRGKFNSHRNEPYSALVEAISNFCSELLLTSSVTQANFKSRIIDAVGDEGIILTKVIPNLTSLIGQQPNVTDAIGVQGTMRFNYLFIKFIRAICSINKIVMLLDDFQWIDCKSSELLNALIADKTIKNLILIGTYRDNDSKEDNSIMNFVVRPDTPRTTIIKLKKFDFDAVNEIVSKALFTPLFQCYQLSLIIFKRTQGNPFYINQFMKELVEQRHIFYCYQSCTWKWDLSCFGDKLDIDVIEFLKNKIKGTNFITKQTLTVASIIGNSFSQRFIEILVNAKKGIEIALEKGMITSVKGEHGNYRFIHDKMRQAASSLIPESNRAQICWYMALKLKKFCTTQELDENIYIIANMLIVGVNSVNKKGCVDEVITIFLDAGMKAMSAVAYEMAYEYFRVGLMLLQNDCWETHYDLSLELCNEAAVSAYCVSNFKEMDKIISKISKNSISSVHSVKSSLLKIKQFNDKQLFEESLLVASEILKRCGEKKNILNYQNLMKSEIEAITEMIASTSDEEILFLKEVQDNYYTALVMIYSEIFSSSISCCRNLMAYCSARIVQLTIEHGLTKYSCLGFNGLGAALSGSGDSIGLRLGNLSLALLKKSRTKEFIPQCYLSFYSRIAPNFLPISSTVEPLFHACKTSLEVGSNFISNCCVNSYLRSAFWSGVGLDKILKDIEELIELPFIRMNTNISSTHQAVINLQDTKKKNPEILDGEVFDIKRCYEGNEQTFDTTRALAMCSVVAFIFGDTVSALNYAKQCRSMIHFIHRKTFFLFYESLVLISCVKTGESANEFMERIEENLAVLIKDAIHAPQNFDNKIHLIQAEIAAKKRETCKAVKLFESAASLAKENGFIHEEAVTHERTGLFYIEQNNLDKAALSILNSYQCYEKWNAYAKMFQLQKKYPTFFSRPLLSNNTLAFDEVQLETRSCGSISNLSYPSFYQHRKKRIRWNDTVKNN